MKYEESPVLELKEQINPKQNAIIKNTNQKMSGSKGGTGLVLLFTTE